MNQKNTEILINELDKKIYQIYGVSEKELT
mgnify:CR=1 FL=1